MDNKSNESSVPPYIKDVQVPSDLKVGEEFIVQVVGDWPNPSWKHIKTDISYLENRVEINYRGVRGAGFALMVLQPVSFEVPLTLNKEGKWKIIVLGRSGNFEVEVNVK